MQATSAPAEHPTAPELPATDHRVGRRLRGTYRIGHLIARGGMGAVYAAEHLRLHRRVAVKVLLDAHAKNPQVLKDFRREARIVSRLRHPHIVQILDIDETEEGQPFFVMEYLDGETAGARLRDRGPLSIPDIVRMISAVTSALTEVHAEGVVHCNLKPTNIFLVRGCGQTDFVKMLDFGVSAEATVSARGTHSEVVGTANYMAPEQVYGRRDLDHRVDQFALAAISYELLSGQRAFSGADTTSVIEAVVSSDPPPLSVAAPGMPSALDLVLGRALSKSPKDRYPSISVFASALANAALGSGLDGVVRGRSDAPSGRYSMAPNAHEDLRCVTLRPSPASEPPTSVRDRLSGVQETSSFSDARAATPETGLQMARLHWRAGNLDEAVACAEQLLDLVTHDKRDSILRMVGSAIPLLDAIFEARAGGGETQLLPGPRLAELRQTLSTHAARLVAYVIGPTSVADLLAMSNMPRRDAIRMIAGLLRRGALARVPSAPRGTDT